MTEPDVTCKESMESVNLILKKLGAPIMTNLYYGTVKQLLERISSVMVDRWVQVSTGLVAIKIISAPMSGRLSSSWLGT